MLKVFARIVAFLILGLAGFAIYYGVKNANYTEALEDYVEISDRFINNQMVDPSVVEAKSDDGKFIRQVAQYYKSFQEINITLDAEMHKLFGAFERQSLADPTVISTNLSRMEEFRVTVETENKRLIALPDQLIQNLQKENLKNLKISTMEELKKGLDEGNELRNTLAQYRSTIASYMLAALEFINARAASVKFSPNGAITFTSQQDQDYFYNLMNTITKMDNELSGILANDREQHRQKMLKLKQAMNR